MNGTIRLTVTRFIVAPNLTNPSEGTKSVVMAGDIIGYNFPAVALDSEKAILAPPNGENTMKPDHMRY